MEDLVTVALVVLGLLLILLLRSLGNSLSVRLRKRRANLTQARRHFVKAASLLGQARTGKVSASEARSLAGTALNEADLSLELDPKDAAILIVKSLALEQLGKPTAALKVLNLALSKGLTKGLSKEERADTLAKRAQLLLAQVKGNRDGRIQEALADLQESITLRPVNPRAHLMLGNCYERSGNKDAAEASFQKALVLDPSSTDAKAALERLIPNGSSEPTTIAVNV